MLVLVPGCFGAWGWPCPDLRYELPLDSLVAVGTTLRPLVMQRCCGQHIGVVPSGAMGGLKELVLPVEDRQWLVGCFGFTSFIILLKSVLEVI